MNLRAILAAAAALATLAITTPADAARRAQEGGFGFFGGPPPAFGSFGPAPTFRAMRSAPRYYRVHWKAKAHRIARDASKRYRSHAHRAGVRKTSPTPHIPGAAPRLQGGEYRGIATQIVPHPPGCPARAFCGCGTALHVFGRNIREAWLARWWYRFPSAAPGPGKVAVRGHHVFAILRDLGGGRVLAYDPNSGGHLTRIHVRSLSGFSVRDPRA